MKYAALLLASLLVLSCSGFSKPVSKPSAKYSGEFLYWCEQEGVWPVYTEKPDCAVVSRAVWDHYPIIVNAEESLIVETMVALESFNEQVGFELFKFEAGNIDPDVAIFVAGSSFFAAAEAKHLTDMGRHYGAVKVYNGLEGLNREDIMQHELGHIVGLKHDHDNKHSIMFPSSTYRVARLERQDVAALRAIYLK